MVGDTDSANVADAAQRDGALTILRRLLGPGRAQFARRPGDRAEILLYPAERFRFFKFPGDDKYNIIRLIILPVEFTEILDRYAFDIAAIADGGLSIVMPIVSGG